MILKLTLQPIIENSILHGILEKEDETDTIRIMAESKNNDIVISVTDDRIGMTPDKLSSILEHSGSGRNGGFGIKNIHERIQLTFGEKYGLSYDSIIGTGTTAKIPIPKVDISNFEA